MQAHLLNVGLLGVGLDGGTGLVSEGLSSLMSVVIRGQAASAVEGIVSEKVDKAGEWCSFADITNVWTR